MAAAWNLCYSDTLPYYIRHEAAKIWISWTYRFSIVLVYVFHKAPLWSRVLQFDVTSISCCFPSTNAIKPDLWDLSVSNYPSWENCLKHQNYFYVEIELLSRSCLEKQTRGWLEQVQWPILGDACSRREYSFVNINCGIQAFLMTASSHPVHL